VAAADDTATALIGRARRALYQGGPPERAPAWPVSAGPLAALADIADPLIHRLFRVGLALEASGLAAGPAGTRLEAAMDELDAIIRDVRTAVLASRSWDAGGLLRMLR
jgi:hypothetical protein